MVAREFGVSEDVQCADLMFVLASRHKCCGVVKAQQLRAEEGVRQVTRGGRVGPTGPLMMTPRVRV